ncbi:vWA domain-containing protein [Bernardetia sp.]|uniref:vWA domain-containing protein n=1 Tax=Bernardetia sp. TaxID=1937974 RepID=UPI0025BA1A04|nr:VWA domain-containing protein [Bernardetia sp.]
MKLQLRYLLVFAFLCFFSVSFAQRKKEIPQTTRLLFVLDASGSMNSAWEGDTRINIARQILSDMIDSIANVPYVEVAMRVYGHQYNFKQKNCQDSKLEVAFGSRNNNQIRTMLDGLQPKGTTPIAYSLEQATKDFPNDGKDTRNVIVMITDGIEACDGDPCAISRGLQQKGIFLKPFIVGMGIEPKYAKGFECMGRFFNAKSSRQFKGFLQEVVKQTLGKTTVTVELLDERNQPREANVHMAFIDQATDKARYNIVHFRDKGGKTDELDIDAIPTYDLIVYTTPPVLKKNVEIIGGRHNVIKVATPQGQLNIVQNGSLDYSTGHSAIVQKQGNHEILVNQQVNEPHNYLIGNYRVEVLTRPTTVFENVRVNQGKTTTLNVKRPGVVTILNKLSGYGSIYVVKSDGSEDWVMNLPEKGIPRTNFALQPGRYRFVFRSSEANDSSYSKSVFFNLSEGGAFTLDILRL